MHDHAGRACVEKHGGHVIKMTGDGMCAVFADPLGAIDATLAFQQALAQPQGDGGLELRARCGIHVGIAERRDDDYFGNTLNRAARIMSAAHGGQVLSSQAVVDLVRGRLPEPISLRELGLVQLRDLASPERLYQLQHPSLRRDFPALRSLEATPNNLPQQSTSFVGRERELEDARGAARKHAPAHARRHRRHRQDAPLAAARRRGARRLCRRRVVRRARAYRRGRRRRQRGGDRAGRAGGARARPAGTDGAMGADKRSASGARQLRARARRLRNARHDACCAGRRACASSPPAGNRCASPARRRFPVPALAVPERARRASSDARALSPRCASSSSGRGGAAVVPAERRATAAPSPTSAGTSTAFRSPSSSRRRACGSCRSPRSPRASDDRFRLLTSGSRTALPAPADAARADRLEPRPAPPSRSATLLRRLVRLRRRLDARGGRGGLRWRRGAGAPRRSSCSRASSTSRSSWRTWPAGATACWRRSASTRARSSRRPAEGNALRERHLDFYLGARGVRRSAPERPRPGRVARRRLTEHENLLAAHAGALICF